VELKAPEIILIQESRSLQEAVAHLVDNSVTETPNRGENDKPLVSLMGLLAGPHASTAFGVLLQRGKPVDFSGAAVAVPCEDTFDHVRVPRAMAQKLFGPQIEAQRAASMSAHRDVDIERVLDDVTREQSVIVVPDREAQSMASLKLSVWDEHAIGIPSAVDEVKHWRSHRTSLIDESNAGWIGRAMHGPVRTALIETLLRGEVDPLEDELTRLFLGRAPLATQH
jgi:DNA-directed RNA polymerase beta' subunit